ncbi:MAG: hypothetical protein RI967_853 [Planctomycetota bacterium]|jgi:hypothetical protein
MSGAGGGGRAFYVGYLPLPRADRRFLALAVPVAAAALLALAATFAVGQRRPGFGVWETGREIVLEGEIVRAPHPVLRTMGDDGVVRRVLLVEMGKLGAGARLEALLAKGGVPADGVLQARVRGYLIERSGQRMIELAEGDAVEVVAPGATMRVPPSAPAVDLGALALAGEIVDSKCWLGVMKPGDGKAHRDCATLCIRGGIPPAFVCRAPDGSWRRALAVAPDGGAIGFEALAPWIGRPLVAHGKVELRDDLAYFHIERFGEPAGAAVVAAPDRAPAEPPSVQPSSHPSSQPSSHP